MRKRLTLAVFVVVVAVSAVELMAAQKKTAPKENARESSQLPTTINQTNNCISTQQKEPSADSVEGWHKLITWPEGITAWALILTLGAITWQACLMRIHASHLDKLASAVDYSSKVMDRQAGDARDFATQTFAILKEQADTALISAKAATESAKAALQQIQLMKDKERARLIVHISDGPEIGPPEAILQSSHRMVSAHIFITNEGPTKAVNVEASGALILVRDLEGGPQEVGFRQEIPRIIGNTDAGPILLEVASFGLDAKEMGTTTSRGTAFSREAIQNVHERTWHFQASGSIVYQDVFGDDHETPFRFVWNPTGYSGIGNWMESSFWIDRSPSST